jgi:hypothetical protein
MSSREFMIGVVTGNCWYPLKVAGKGKDTLQQAFGLFVWLSQYHTEDGSVDVADGAGIPRDGAGVAFYSHDGETEYSGETKLDDIPTPSVLIAVLLTATEEMPAPVLASAIARPLLQHEGVQSFLQQQPGNIRTTSATTSDKIPLSFDVFISYTAGDSAIADELRTELQQSGLKCFMAEKDIQVASEWQDSIRDALRNSKRILVLLTPRSVNRPWVLMETGAAWALGKPLIPALVHVAADDLFDPIRRHQARVIETTAQRKALVTELTGK